MKIFKKNFEKIKRNKGFVILFAVTLSSILLAIALGVSNIALKEIKFSTSAKDASDAFFAADTGAECALFNDKSSSTSFIQNGGSGIVRCQGGNITLAGAFPSFSFVVSGLGSGGVSCANVNVVKDTTTNAPYTITTVTAKGYNIGDATCSSSNPDRIQREIRISY